MKLTKNIFLGFAMTLVIANVGCEKKFSTEPNVELTQDMMHDPAVKAQDYDLDKTDKRANFLPPQGTVPRGSWSPYPNFANDEAAKNYENPVKANTEILAKGDRKFQIYCGVCHGPNGNGHGTVAEKMLVKPPTLIGAKVRGWTDGQIFHLITRGRGMMKSYESQIPSAEDRWAIVHYIRHLQKNQKVDEGTVPAAAPSTGN